MWYVGQGRTRKQKESTVTSQKKPDPKVLREQFLSIGMPGMVMLIDHIVEEARGGICLYANRL
jgi:hypothetical protein